MFVRFAIIMGGGPTSVEDPAKAVQDYIRFQIFPAVSKMWRGRI